MAIHKNNFIYFKFRMIIGNKTGSLITDLQHYIRLYQEISLHLIPTSQTHPSSQSFPASRWPAPG